MTLSFEVLEGAAVATVLDDVARLRIAVFRDFPYLYDGDLDYERQYLARFAAAAGAVVVVARDGSTIVGAATGCPLVAEHEEFIAPFRKRSMNVDHIFYCAESVLRPAWRGQGAGHAFFDAREAQARKRGATHSVFCGVVRADDHPARPANYAALDPFWRKRGYEKLEGLVTSFSWKDLGDVEETAKPMQFWMKTL